MPNPEDFRFHELTPKGPPVRVGEELVFRLTPFSQLQLRVQCLEQAIACCPFCYSTYNRELERVGLKKLDLQVTAEPLVA